MPNLWKLRYGNSQIGIYEVTGTKATIESLYHNLHTRLKDNDYDFQLCEEYRYCPLNVLEVEEIVKDEEFVFYRTEDI